MMNEQQKQLAFEQCRTITKKYINMQMGKESFNMKFTLLSIINIWSQEARFSTHSDLMDIIFAVIKTEYPEYYEDVMKLRCLL